MKISNWVNTYNKGFLFSSSNYYNPMGAHYGSVYYDDSAPSTISELHQAARDGNEEEIKNLISVRGLDANLRDNNGQTPLHHAATANKMTAIGVLINLGADTKAQDGKGICRKIKGNDKLRALETKNSTGMIEFKGSHFPNEVILMAIRLYVAYPLSYRHVEELMEERGIAIDHATVNRWVVKYSPKLEAEFRQVKKRVVKSWRMDETYIKIKGQWMYYYRAVDKENQTIDFFLSPRRDAAAARAFFDKAIGSNGKPEKVNIDKSGANLAGLQEVNEDLPEDQKIEIRQVKYLNNSIEQDHRGIKRITKPMLGFKSFICAQATLAGIELYHMIRKGQNLLKGKLSTWEQFYALVG